MNATAAKKEEHAPTSVTVTETTELVTIEGLTPAQIFTTGKVTELLGKIEALKNGFKGDVSTAGGRKDIVSFAARIRRTKTLLDDEIGKTYVAVLKDEPKRIDGLRKQIRDTLDLWAAEVRRPVTEIEERDAARKQAHEKHLADIGATLSFPPGQPSSEEVQRRINFVNLYQQREWEEFDDLYKSTYKGVMEVLTTALSAAKLAEDNAAELARMKKQEAERLATESVERARLAGIEEGRRAAEAEAARAVAPPPSPVAAAVTAPIVQPPQPPQQPSRDAATERKAQVHRETLASLVSYGCREDGAKALVTAIAQGKIANVYIEYGE